MKKEIVVFLVLAVFVLGGCSTDDETNGDDEQIPDDQTIPNDDTTGDDNEDQNQTEINDTTEADETDINETIDDDVNATSENMTDTNVFVIEIEDISVSQEEVVIEKGTTVVWKNKENQKHMITIKGERVQSDHLLEGDTFNHTFNEVGEFYYVDAVFPKYVNGWIIVE